ncbi:MAG TPA: DUF167 domain-containing protein [Coriobacteriia bacterium]|nr:DUF167 domain-containing protein [Coriobacteriia bacterium]
MARLAVHVTPKAGVDAISGWRGSELGVRVTSAPEGGKANAAVCRVVAGALGVPKTHVSVARGDTSRHKILEISGVDDGFIAAALGTPEPGLF